MFCAFASRERSGHAGPCTFSPLFSADGGTVAIYFSITPLRNSVIIVKYYADNVYNYEGEFSVAGEAVPGVFS